MFSFFIIITDFFLFAFSQSSKRRRSFNAVTRFSISGFRFASGSSVTASTS